ncbi:MAG: (deoxy)nucleoside triphosphate pyrophosphohydrolase [Planctomycetota bacterium]
MIEVCAAVVVRDGRVLVARRTRPAELRGLWEFPGGKLERGESPGACLARELREELALAVEIGEPLGSSERAARSGEAAGLRLTAYAARTTDNAEPSPIDGTHDSVRWVAADELAELELAPLDVPLLPGALRHLSDPDAHLR